jgi:hypothetical protein
MFRWRDFLDRRGIEYKREGARNMRIPCPFCPPNTSRMSVSDRGWYCWVNPDEHKGGNPNRLVAALLRCSLQEAQAITGVGGIKHVDAFSETIAALRAGNNPNSRQVIRQVRQVEWQSEFKPIDDGVLAQPFVRYLESEKRGGYTRAQIYRMTQDFGIHYCVDGLFRYRLIFPIYFEKKLVAWTARSISPSERLRYRAEGQPPHWLLWFDDLMQGGERIVLTEGPFDALKLRMLGQPATCFFTARPSTEQKALLHSLLPRYRQRVLLLDNNTLATALRVAGELQPFNVRIAVLPTGIKDPALLKNFDCLDHVL